LFFDPNQVTEVLPSQKEGFHGQICPSHHARSITKFQKSDKKNDLEDRRGLYLSGHELKHAWNPEAKEIEMLDMWIGGECVSPPPTFVSIGDWGYCW
jgi:hypothetical protein